MNLLKIVRCGLQHLILIAILGILMNVPPLLAQETNSPSLRIVGVDTANFPQVNISFVAENLPPPSSPALVVLEDGAEQRLDQANSQFKSMDAQVALLLDASSTIVQAGRTGDPRYVEAGYAVQRLVRGDFLKNTDWLSFIVPTGRGQNSTLQTWTRDHGAVSNSIFQFKPDRSIGSTMLSSLILFALDTFDDVNEPAVNTLPQKSMVIFSDGIVQGDANLDQAVQQAKQMKVRLHTVLVGPETNSGRIPMQQLAADTGGQYLHLASLEMLDDFWPAVASTGSQGVLTYRSQKADPRQVTVRLQLANGQTLEQIESIPPLTPPLQPANLQIQLVPPLSNDTMERTSDQPEATLAKLEPKEVVIEVQVSWPDGHPRLLKSLTVNLGVKTETLTAPSLAQPPQVRLSVADLGTGAYPLNASAVDEFGLTANSTPRSFKIVEQRPPLPSPTPLPPTPTPLPQAEDFFQELGWGPVVVVIASLVVLTLAALGVAVYALRTVRQRAPEVRLSDTHAKTEPFVIDKSQKYTPSNPKARLILVSGGNGELPQQIDLYSGNTLIGRDPTLVNVVLKERRISRYHCRVNEEADGTFRMWDEGSTSGTSVNFEQVGMSGQPLKQGDLINIGPVQYRFEPHAKTGPLEQPERKPAFSDEDNLLTHGTEPFEPNAGQATEPVDLPARQNASPS